MNWLIEWDQKIRRWNADCKRNALISASLPSALDLLTLVMQAGLDFQVALQHYVTHAPAGPLREECERVFHELQLGRSRAEALRALRERTTEPSLRETARTLVQGIELGASLTPLLREQARLLRAHHAAMAEKKAVVAPLKLLFPLLVFIFPTVFIVLLGPLLLSVKQGGGW